MTKEIKKFKARVKENAVKECFKRFRVRIDLSREMNKGIWRLYFDKFRSLVEVKEDKKIAKFTKKIAEFKWKDHLRRVRLRKCYNFLKKYYQDYLVSDLIYDKYISSLKTSFLIKMIKVYQLNKGLRESEFISQMQVKQAFTRIRESLGKVPSFYSKRGSIFKKSLFRLLLTKMKRKTENKIQRRKFNSVLLLKKIKQRVTQNKRISLIHKEIKQLKRTNYKKVLFKCLNESMKAKDVLVEKTVEGTKILKHVFKHFYFSLIRSLHQNKIQFEKERLECFESRRKTIFMAFISEFARKTKAIFSFK